MAKTTKATFAKTRDFTYAYKVDGITPGFHTAPFGRQLDDLKKARTFMESAKSYHVGAKHRSTLAAVREWVKEHKPSQFYAKWTSDSDNYKDDSVQIFYIDEDRN